MEFSLFATSSLLAIFAFAVTFSTSIKKQPEKKRVKYNKDR